MYWQPRGESYGEGERIRVLLVNIKILPTLFLLIGLSQFAAAAKPAARLDGQIGTLIDTLGHCKIIGATGKTFIIAIVHDNTVSDETVGAVKAAFDRQKEKLVGGKPVSTVVVPFEGSDDLTEKLRLIRARGLFLTENNEKIVREVLNSTRALKIISMSNVPDYVHWLGVTLGVETQGSKPRIMVNLASCQQEKIEFDEEILANASVFF